jgi:hypothetical protein
MQGFLIGVIVERVLAKSEDGLGCNSDAALGNRGQCARAIASLLHVPGAFEISN